MGRITEESIQRVMTTVNIVDLINGYVPLKRAGTSWKACCPFHSERTPSFNVSPTRNNFHCFGCGKAGGPVRFVMEMDNIPFADAVRKLASKYGIHLIEEADSPEMEGQRSIRTKLLALHRDITAWFHKLLLRSEPAEPARAYLKSRGINSEIARRWHIGYAPQDPQYYRTWLKDSRYTEGLLVQAGIFSPRDENQPERGGYPRFKHRVMFPIRNDHGDTIAFSGRILDIEASPAKYINSPETPIFKKSQVFFGLDMAKKAIHKTQTAVICEGQIDMIMCYEAGIENIIAPLGTAFTKDHSTLLKRHTEQVIICFDADNAGIKAAHSCFTELARENIFVKVAAMPPGDDPDTLIRRDGVDALKDLLASARDFIDFQIDQRLPKLDPADIRERMRLLRDVTHTIAKIRDRMVQESFINRAALRLAAPAADLRRMVSAHAREILRTQEQSQERDTRRPDPTHTAAAETDAEDEEEIPIIENPAMRQLLHLALCHAPARDWIQQNTSHFPWAAYTGGLIMEKLLKEPLDLTTPAAASAWMAQLTATEEILFTNLQNISLPGDPVENAELALLSLRSQSLTTRLSILNERQRQPGMDQKQIIAAATEIHQLQKENQTLQQRLREIRIEE